MRGEKGGGGGGGGAGGGGGVCPGCFVLKKNWLYIGVLGNSIFKKKTQIRGRLKHPGPSPPPLLKGGGGCGGGGGFPGFGLN